MLLVPNPSRQVSEWLAVGGGGCGEGWGREITRCRGRLPGVSCVHCGPWHVRRQNSAAPRDAGALRSVSDNSVRVRELPGASFSGCSSCS